MNSTNLYQEKLQELIDQCLSIDALVIQARQFPEQQRASMSKELEVLRLKQRETIDTLHRLEIHHVDEWENIGLGG